MLDLIEARRAEVVQICQRYQVKRLDVFGSAASGDFDSEASDLDFVVEFEPLSPVPYKRAYFAMLAELEALFRRKVDLVTTGSLRNPDFVSNVERTRELVYGG